MLRILALVPVYILAVFGTLLVAGQFVALPYFNFMGATATQWWLWMAVAGAALGLIAAKLRSWPAVALALITAAFYAFAGAQQVAVARENNIALRPANFFGISYTNDVAAGPTDRYAEFGSSGPVILWVHGGGWVGGSIVQTYHLQWLADQGFHVFSVPYSLSTETEHNWDKNTQEILHAIDDITARTGAQKVGIAGDSAGGHLALLAAYQSEQVAAVSTIYPAAYPGIDQELDPVLDPIAQHMLESYLGPNADIAEVTPATYLATAKPTVIVSGLRDHLVLPQGPQLLADALGDKATFIGVPWGEHGMDHNKDGIPAEIFRQATLRLFKEHVPAAS